MNLTGRSILLIDDNAAIREGLRTLFEASGFSCRESENGAEGIREAQQMKPDLIVLDFSMPGMNGLEAIPLLKNILPETPILMFTMFANPELTKIAIAAGATAVFSKDQAGTLLLPKAESLLKSEAA